MKKSALIFAPAGEGELTSFERELLAVGFHTLRVNTVREVAYRVDNEVFSILICVDSEDGLRQRQLQALLMVRPFGLTTPILILGKQPQPVERSALNSILDQYFPLSSSPKELAAFCAETHALRSQKAKPGHLGALSVPQLLYRAAHLRFSGAFVVERPEEKCIIYVERGHVVFASSNREENRFGEFLVQQGIITREQFLHASNILKQTRKRLGKILVEEGSIKPQVLQTLIQSQVKHIIYNVFDWPEGEYFILFDERSGQEESIASFEIGPLILEGVRFKFNEKTLDQEFYPFDQKVSLAIPLAECKKRIHLGKNDLDFLGLIGDGRLLEDLLTLNSYSRLEALKLLYVFRVLGLLAFERSRGRVARAVPPRTERVKVVDELFARKSTDPSLPQTPLLPPEVPDVPTAGRSRAWQIGFLTGALALSGFLSIITFVDPRSTRDSLSIDRPTSIQAPPQIQIPQAPVVSAVQPTVQPSTAGQPEAETADSSLSELTIPPLEESTETASPNVTADGTQPPGRVAAKPIPSAPKYKPTPIPIPARAKSGDARLDPNSSPRVAAVRPKVRKTPSPAVSLFSRLKATADRQRKAKDLSGALYNYRRAAKMNPKHVGVMISIGDILFEMDRVGEAKQAYEKAARIQPSHPQPYLSLGTLYVINDQKPQAARAYRMYLQRVRRTAATKARIAEVQRILATLDAQP